MPSLTLVPTKTSKEGNRFARRDSLIKQASLDREQNEGLRRQNTLRSQKDQRLLTLCKPLLQCLTNHSIKLIKNANEEGQLNLLVILHCLGEEILQSVLQRFLKIGLHLTYLEISSDFEFPGVLKIKTKLSGKKWMFIEILNKLVLEKSVERIELKNLFLYEKNDDEDSTKIWFPQHVSELDLCAHVVVKYEPTEDPTHPVNFIKGFGDKRYIERRTELNKLANIYRYGSQIPLVKYTEEEHNTWRIAYQQLYELRESHTCIEYQKNITEMERIGLIKPDRIPQIRDLSAYIQKKTGFELRPCGGLLSARDFLASLAFRVFQPTLYVRHSRYFLRFKLLFFLFFIAPHHCPEPDVIHEILGHCPMFVHLAQLSQDIGLLSLGATDEQIERLATVYWFIIEFGLCKQNGKLVAIGAGLLSAYGELKYACSNEPEHEPFNPEITALRPYVDSDYQPVYFVADSIEKALENVRAFANSMCPQYTNIYNPFTRTVKQLDNKSMLQHKAVSLQKECEELQRELGKIIIKNKEEEENFENKNKETNNIGHID
ncbi:BH4_AAA_HYDROXYL_2 domain-containing protein [Meloidogyne graminicola]|uniref:BH4_AAA_HYDROXYL_2 domain-containing protein n=1 Tax=Meloidogyne graminicola TaxID=189291 RepID=A0A8S9ZZH4_9BILA|nr:BH4_AAA_HYDROXYL_2 domain-containing protein [Meloidogyne graminicola]